MNYAALVNHIESVVNDDDKIIAMLFSAILQITMKAYTIDNRRAFRKKMKDPQSFSTDQAKEDLKKKLKEMVPALPKLTDTDYLAIDKIISFLRLSRDHRLAILNDTFFVGYGDRLLTVLKVIRKSVANLALTDPEMKGLSEDVLLSFQRIELVGERRRNISVAGTSVVLGVAILLGLIFCSFSNMLVPAMLITLGALFLIISVIAFIRESKFSKLMESALCDNTNTVSARLANTKSVKSEVKAQPQKARENIDVITKKVTKPNKEMYQSVLQAVRGVEREVYETTLKKEGDSQPTYRFV